MYIKSDSNLLPFSMLLNGSVDFDFFRQNLPRGCVNDQYMSPHLHYIQLQDVDVNTVYLIYLQDPYQAGVSVGIKHSFST